MYTTYTYALRIVDNLQNPHPTHCFRFVFPHFPFAGNIQTHTGAIMRL